MGEPEIVVCSTASRVYRDPGASSDKPITSILTFPVHDLAGDYVNPSGGDISKYPIPFPQPDSRFGPVSNWGHEVPIGRGAVCYKSLRDGDNTITVLVGETSIAHKAADLEGIDIRRRNPATHRSWDKEPPFTFDEILQYADEAEPLIREEVAIGTSIEFDQFGLEKGVDYWDLGKPSLLDQRPARHFERWNFLGYAHARIPVNPGCMTLGSDRVATAVEKSIRIAQTGKYGTRVLSPIIVKAFLDLKDLTIDSAGRLTTPRPYTIVPSLPSSAVPPSHQPITGSKSTRTTPPAGTADDGVSVKSKAAKIKKRARMYKEEATYAASTGRHAINWSLSARKNNNLRYHSNAHRVHHYASHAHQRAAKYADTPERVAQHTKRAAFHAKKRDQHARKAEKLLMMKCLSPDDKAIYIKATRAAKRWISKKIEKIHAEGVRGKPVKNNKQAIAIAFSMYRKRKGKKATSVKGIHPLVHRAIESLTKRAEHHWHRMHTARAKGKGFEGAVRHQEREYNRIHKAIHYLKTRVRESSETKSISLKDHSAYSKAAHSFSKRAHDYAARANIKNTYMSHTKARIAHNKAHDLHSRAAASYRKAGLHHEAQQHEGIAIAHADQSARHDSERLKAKRSRWYKSVDTSHSAIVLKADDPILKDVDSHGHSARAHWGAQEVFDSHKGSLASSAHQHSTMAMHHATAGDHSSAASAHHHAAAHLEEHAKRFPDTDHGKKAADAAKKHRLAASHHENKFMSSKAVETPQNGAVVVKGEALSEGTDPSGQTKGPQPGVGYRSTMNFVQGLMDLCASFEQEAGESDSMEIRKFAEMMCKKGKKLAEEAKGRAERYHTKMKGSVAGDDGKGIDDEEKEVSAEEKAIELADDGALVIKAYPTWKPRRYTAKDLSEPKAPEPEYVSPEEEAAALERAAKARRQFNDLMVAGRHNGVVT